MSDPFHSSKRSVAWGHQHIQNFERQITEFFKTNPYSNVCEYDPKSNGKAYKIKLTKPMPVALENIAADAVNNLRSALDQACYALQPAGEKGRYATFPFSSDAAQFETAVKGRCKALPKEIVDLIRGFKPYKGGDDLLWALNEVCNTNKHGILAPVAACTSVVRFKKIDFVPSGVGAGFALQLPVWDRAKNEMVLFLSDKRSTVEADVDFSAHIVFCDIEIVDGQPAEAVLKDFFNIANRIVMTIEAEAKRIGLV